MSRECAYIYHTVQLDSERDHFSSLNSVESIRVNSSRNMNRIIHLSCELVGLYLNCKTAFARRPISRLRCMISAHSIPSKQPSVHDNHFRFPLIVLILTPISNSTFRSRTDLGVISTSSSSAMYAMFSYFKVSMHIGI